MIEKPSDLTIALEDDTSPKTIDRLYELVSMIQNRFDRSERARAADEDRWTKAYYNYRGLYTKDVRFTSTEKSRVFVKITKVKVLAAYGQIMDVLLANGKVPLSIEATELPEGIAEAFHVDMDDATGAPEEDSGAGPLGIGYSGDGNDLKPGETLMDRIGTFFADKMEKAKVKMGYGTKPQSVTFEPAKVAAKKMEKKIHDQLGEARADIHLRSCAFEMALLGTGILKGPFTLDKEYPRWKPTGEYDPVLKPVPRVEAVSVWNFYPDPEARSMEDADYVIQRHKLTKAQMRQLKRRPFFRVTEIESAISAGPNYTQKPWEQELIDSSVVPDTERYEVLEYWGVIDTDLVEDYGVDIPEELDGQKDIQVNVWLCGDKILRLVLNPFTPARIPFFAVPYELNPYNFFGIGLPENMEDSQTLMNGFTRLAVDNAVLSGNLVFEVDETHLVPGQDLTMHPGKIIRRSGGAPGQSIFSHKWQNVTQENMMMFDKFRQLADDSTGIPSIAHGQGGVQGGPGRTAAGMSMFMGAAAMSIKTVVRNIDDYLLRPLGEALFAWNMQFDFDPSIKGDLEVKARGTSSLMQREVKSQRLIQFLQVASSPTVAPLVKFPTLIRELAESMDIDPEKIINNPEEAQLMATLLGISGGAAPGGAPGGPMNPMDQTGAGGGNISVGAPPMPGDPQFSGNGGQQQQAPMVM